MTYFTVITGIATLVSLFLQLSGLFPNYGRYISQVTSFLFGATIGLLVNIGSSLEVTLPESLTLKELVGLVLFCGAGLLIFVLVLVSVFVDDEKRRQTAIQAASAVSGFLIFLLLLFLNDFFPRPRG